MDTHTAIALVEPLVFMPGWTIDAQPDERFESAICVKIAYPGPDYSRRYAPDYTAVAREQLATFILMVGDLGFEQFLRRIFDFCLACLTHEAREAFRVAPSWWAPFHPHKRDGINRWGDPKGDLLFSGLS